MSWLAFGIPGHPCISLCALHASSYIKPRWLGYCERGIAAQDITEGVSPHILLCCSASAVLHLTHYVLYSAIPGMLDLSEDEQKLTAQLDDPSLLHFDSFVGDSWVQAKDGQRFEVIGMQSAIDASSHADSRSNTSSTTLQILAPTSPGPAAQPIPRTTSTPPCRPPIHPSRPSAPPPPASAPNGSSPGTR